jgi:acyl carrier protein
MEEKEIYSRLCKLITDHLSIDEEKIKPEASFVEDLGADSLDTVELTMAIEEEFGIDIPDEDAENIRTVKDALDYVSRKVATE